MHYPYTMQNGTIIWFVRHGESETNIGLPSDRPERTGLTEKGRGDAERIKNELKQAAFSPDLIISSPYNRAQETAKPTRSGFPNTPFEIWEDVKEFTYLGSAHNTYCTREDRRALVQKFWHRCDPFYRDGEGESFEDLIIRAQKTLNALKKRKEKFIIIFSHQQFITVIEWLVRGWVVDLSESMELFRNIRPCLQMRNGFISKIREDEDGGFQLDKSAKKDYQSFALASVSPRRVNWDPPRRTRRERPCFAANIELLQALV